MTGDLLLGWEIRLGTQEKSDFSDCLKRYRQIYILTICGKIHINIALRIYSIYLYRDFE